MVDTVKENENDIAVGLDTVEEYEDGIDGVVDMVE